MKSSEVTKSDPLLSMNINFVLLFLYLGRIEGMID